MKTILITGGSRGIGRATVEQFLSKRWNVITTSTSGTLNYSEPNLSVFQLDLANPVSISSLIKSINNSSNKIDVLINNAATSEEEDDFSNIVCLRKTLEVNLIGPIDLTQQLLPFFNNDGIIVNFSSQMASLTRDFDCDYPAYRISKTAVNMFTRTLSKSPVVIEKNIKVYSFDPGWVKTDMGGPDAPRQPEEPALEIFELVNSGLPTGEFYLGLKKRDW